MIVSRSTAWLLVAAGVAGCAARTAEKGLPDGPGGELVLAVRADATGIFPNPPAQAEGFTYAVNDHLFEGLVSLGPDDRLEPSLAVAWTNPDDRHWRFELRPGVLFSDGTPLVADDVVLSLRETMARPFPHHRSLATYVESVRAVDSMTVEIVTREPFAALPTQLITLYVFPAREVVKPVVPPIGTGPYVLASREPGRRTVLRRNPRYWGVAPAFETVTFEVIADTAERVAALEEGRAQVIDQIPLGELDRLESDSRLQVLCRSAYRVVFLEFQIDSPPFDQPAVRRAIDLAIDREELNRRALAGRATPASQLVPALVAGFNPSIALPRVDLPAARRLLAEAGFRRGLDVRLDGPSDRYVNGVEILAEVARQLAEIGIRAELRPQPKAEFFAERAARRSPFHLMGWSSPTGQAWSALNELAHARPKEGPPSWNVSGLADPELDTLIDQANRSLRHQNDLFAEAFARLAELHVFVPLVVLPSAAAHSRAIAWQSSPDLSLRAFRMHRASRAEDSAAGGR
jgi:peptide/nickel transport system substrate-binding protein